PGAGTISSWRLSPDSRWAVYGVSRGPGGLVELFGRPIGGVGPGVKLSSPGISRAGVNAFDISSDSSHVVVTADNCGEGIFKLYTRAIDGSDQTARLSQEGNGTVAGFTLNPNGQVLFLAAADNPNVLEAYSRFMTNSDPAIKLNASLVRGGNVTKVALSADTRWAVYQADQETDEIFGLYSLRVSESMPGEM